MLYAELEEMGYYSHGLERDRFVNAFQVQLVLFVTLVFRWELEHHALAVVVNDPECVPGNIHPLGYGLLVVLLVKFLLPA